MKNLFKNLMLVAVAAMAFTACTENNEEVNAVNEKVTLTFVAGFGEDTRVSLDNTDNDKVYKAAWEDGDTITFAVYDDATTSVNSPKEIKTMNVVAPSESVELTVTFDNLADGNVIRAFVNYIAVKYGDNYYFDTDGYYAPYDNDPEVYASASVVYAEGVDYATLTFEHDFAYGLMTFENLPITIDRLFYIDIKADGKNVSVNYDHLTGNQFWFNIDEDLDVDKLDIVAVSKDSPAVKYYFSRTFANDGEFKFTKGRVSRFTVKTWKGELATPEVETTVSGKTITLNWASVEGADGYRIEITDYNGFSDEVSLDEDAVSYVFTAPLEDTYYYFNVYACANEDNESYVTSQVCDIYEVSGNTTPAIILNPTSLSFDADGGEKTFTVTLKNIDGDFTYTVAADWLTVTRPDSGASLAVSAPAYDNESEDRSATITITAGDLTKDIAVTQSKKSAQAGTDGTEANPHIFESPAQGYAWYQLVFGTATDGASLIMELASNIYLANLGVEYSLNGEGPWYSSGNMYTAPNGTTYFNADFAANSTAIVTKNADGVQYDILFKIVAGGVTTYYKTTVPSTF